MLDYKQSMVVTPRQVARSNGPTLRRRTRHNQTRWFSRHFIYLLVPSTTNVFSRGWNYWREIRVKSLNRSPHWGSKCHLTTTSGERFQNKSSLHSIRSRSENISIFICISAIKIYFLYIHYLIIIFLKIMIHKKDKQKRQTLLANYCKCSRSIPIFLCSLKCIFANSNIIILIKKI